MYKTLLCLIFICTLSIPVDAQTKSPTAKTVEWIIMLQPEAEIRSLLVSFQQRSISIEYKKVLSRSMNIHLVAVHNSVTFADVCQEQVSVRFIQKK